MAAGLISCIAMAVTAACLSAGHKKSMDALFIGIAFFLAYELVKVFLSDTNAFIDILLTVIPISGTEMIAVTEQYNSVLDLLGAGIWIPYVSVAAGAVWAAAAGIMAVNIYTKREG